MKSLDDRETRLWYLTVFLSLSRIFFKLIFIFLFTVFPNEHSISLTHGGHSRILYVRLVMGYPFTTMPQREVYGSRDKEPHAGLVEKRRRRRRRQARVCTYCDIVGHTRESEVDRGKQRGERR